MKRLAALAALSIVPLAAGCQATITPDGWYDIGPASPPVVAVPIVRLMCHDPAGWPFIYEGPRDTAPMDVCDKKPLNRGAK